MSKKISRKPTKTVKVTCTKCGRVVRVSKGSNCHDLGLCYACISAEMEELSDVIDNTEGDEK